MTKAMPKKVAMKTAPRALPSEPRAVYKLSEEELGLLTRFRRNGVNHHLEGTSNSALAVFAAVALVSHSTPQEDGTVVVDGVNGWIRVLFDLTTKRASHIRQNMIRWGLIIPRAGSQLAELVLPPEYQEYLAKTAPPDADLPKSAEGPATVQAAPGSCVGIGEASQVVLELPPEARHLTIKAVRPGSDGLEETLAEVTVNLR